MGREGVEPSRCHHRRILSPLRLPIPPSPRHRVNLCWLISNYDDSLLGIIHKNSESSSHPVRTDYYRETEVVRWRSTNGIDFCGDWRVEWCAVELIFLRRVGGSFIFVHRLLMEYFAEDGCVRYLYWDYKMLALSRNFEFQCSAILHPMNISIATQYS